MKRMVNDYISLKDMEEAIKLLKKQAIPTKWIFSWKWPFITRYYVIDVQRSRHIAQQIEWNIRKFL